MHARELRGTELVMKEPSKGGGLGPGLCRSKLRGRESELLGMRDSLFLEQSL